MCSVVRESLTWLITQTCVPCPFPERERRKNHSAQAKNPGNRCLNTRSVAGRLVTRGSCNPWSKKEENHRTRRYNRKLRKLFFVCVCVRESPLSSPACKQGNVLVLPDTSTVHQHTLHSISNHERQEVSKPKENLYTYNVLSRKVCWSGRSVRFWKRVIRIIWEESQHLFEFRMLIGHFLE
jgi:hypothetical protein